MEKIIKKSFFVKVLVFWFGLLCANVNYGQAPEKLKIKFVDYFFENGSPLIWERQGGDSIKILLPADYERESPNCQTDHWNFRLIAEPGTRVTLTISKLTPDVYNGRKTKSWWKFKNPISLYISHDNEKWIPLSATTSPDLDLIVDFTMKGEEVHVARIPVYSTVRLETLKNNIRNNRLVKIFNIGTTVEGRPLEIIQLGNGGAHHSVLIRARAHPWEAGGNWVVEGLVKGYLAEKDENWPDELCFYIMPMAGKDGVVRGMTRFNSAGKDINRNMDRSADPELCPENYALENFIISLIASGKKPSLGIDLHNDDAGGFHLAYHDRNDTIFVSNMKLLDGLMRKYTSYAENTRYAWKTAGQQVFPVTFSDGLLMRFGIESLVYELNANWFEGLKKIPESEDYIEIGKNLNRVLYEYLNRMK